MIGSGNCRQVVQLRRIGSGWLKQLVYSPDGKWLAAATSIGAVLYDVTAQVQLWEAGGDFSLAGVAFSSDDSTLVGADILGNIYHWALSDGKLTQKIASPNPSSEPPTVTGLSPDGSLLVLPGYDDFIYVFSASDGSSVQKLQNEMFFGDMVHRLSVSPDNRIVASLHFNGTIRLWRVRDGGLLHVVENPGEMLAIDISFSPDATRLLVEFSDRDGQPEMHMLSVSSGTWQTRNAGGRGIYSSDGKILAVETAEGIQLSSTRDGIVKTLPETSRLQGKPAFSPDGKFLAAGTREGVHIWQVEEADLYVTLPGEFPGYASLALSPDGLLLAAGTDGGVEVRNVADGSLVRKLLIAGGLNRVDTTAYSPDGQVIAGAVENTLYLWRAEDGAMLRTMEADGNIQDLAFSMDAQMIAVAQYGQPLAVWGVLDGEVRYILGSSGELEFLLGYDHVVFSPNGQFLAASQTPGSIDLWTIDGKLIKNFAGHDIFGFDVSLAFSPDSRYLASGAMDRQVILWDTVILSRAGTMKSKDASIKAVAFTPGGQYLVSASSDGVIRFWLMSSKSVLCTYAGHDDAVTTVAFTPDGRLLVTQSDDGTVRVWGLP